MASLEELQAQRQRILAEIKRRGGKEKAPNYVKQLETVEAQIRTAKGAAESATATPARTDIASQLPEQIKTVQDAMRADSAVARNEAETNIGYSNPDVNGPLGSSTTNIDPTTGRVSVDQKLSSGQQGVLSADEQLSQIARETAGGYITGGMSQPFQATTSARPTFDPNGTLSSPFTSRPENRLADNSALSTPFEANLTARTASGDLVADRARIENEIFANLTQDADKNYETSRQKAEQWAQNRGIPVGSKQWDDVMERVDKADAYARNEARASAVKMGGDEYSRSVGIGETMRANDFSQQIGTRQQNASEYGQQAGIDEARIDGEFNRDLSGRTQNFAEEKDRWNMGDSNQQTEFNQQLMTRQQMSADTGMLSGLGSGPIIPNYPTYQAPVYDVGAPSDIAAKLKQLGLDEKQINAAINAMKPSGGGGGSSSGTSQTPTTPSPFNNTPPPGL